MQKPSLLATCVVSVVLAMLQLSRTNAGHDINKNSKFVSTRLTILAMMGTRIVHVAELLIIEVSSMKTMQRK